MCLLVAAPVRFSCQCDHEENQNWTVYEPDERNFRECAIEGFIMHQTQLFQVFGDNPVPWDVNNKTMSFSPIKTAFLVRAHHIK